MSKYFCNAVLLSILFSSNLVAQQELEEIVVTAQRREQNLQDVPVSITAFSQSQLVQGNINEAKDYFQFTPNVSFTEDGEAGSRSIGISMRGISDFANALTDIGGLSNSFGIYLDEFNIANSANKVANPQLQDLQSVEVLRGPQGTYFGRNATGGALNMTTALPSEDPYYEVGAGYSRFNTWNVTAIVNTPVTDNVFVRGVAWYEESDGFIKNLSPTGNDAGYDQHNLRGAVRWLVNDRVTADFSVMHTKENDGADSNVNSGVLDTDTIGSTPSVLAVTPVSDVALSSNSSSSIPASFFDRAHEPLAAALPVDSGRGFFPNNRRYINKDFYESNTGELTLLNLRLNYQADNWSLRSITGYMDSEAQRRFDQDVTQHGLYETYAGRHSETFSQELRLNYTNDNWDITVGGLYASDESLDFGLSPIGPDGFAFGITINPDGTLDASSCAFCLNPGEIIGSATVLTFDATSYALFGDVTWTINDKFKATLGVRYTRDELDFENYDGFQALPFSDVQGGKRPPLSDLQVADKRSFNDISPRFVLNYTPTDNINTYASVSAGYKPGGAVLETVTRFEDERLWNFEAGIKLQAFDNRLKFNAAAFYMDWKRMQVPTLDTSLVNGQIILNTEILNIDAQSKGFELEMQALPTEHLFIGGGVGYLDTEIDGFGADDPFIFEGMAFDLDGQTLPRSPEWTVNVVGQYNFNVMAKYESFVRLEWTYRDETFSDIEALASVNQPLNLAGFNTGVSGNGVSVNFPRDDFPFRVPSFDVFNIRAGISGKRWSLVAYVENVFDDNYYTGTQENFGIGGIRIRPHFRTAGVNIRFFSE